MTSLNRNADEQARNARAIESLVAELHQPETRVTVAYENCLKRLGESASVTEFLSVLARKGARECLLCVERKSGCALRADCLLERPGTPQ